MVVSGSSPRAWGILGIFAAHGQIQRFIPTCVGNTWGASPAHRHGPVHPHVRGEYALAPSPWGRDYGSSPRAWGIPALWTRSWRPCRFIPTCVGNTPRWRAYAGKHPVHPHVRGEYSTTPTVPGLSTGSSPRAWGIRSGARTPRPITAVHPHVRGEYGSLYTWSSSLDGSSPRAWGIRGRPRPRAWWRWFIPTCVGNTGR